MTDIMSYPQHSDPANPVLSDWPQYNSSELYTATAGNSNEGAVQVRDLHVKIENKLKGDGGSGGVDRGIDAIVVEMLHVNVPLQERYGRLDLADLLKKNKNVKGKDGLPILSAALGILEKYGRNLLKPTRPPQWKTISFSNAVFRTRVDIIKGARDVLKLLGYSEIVEDGVCFPDHMQAPDNNTVAMVTTDLILAKAEIEAFSRKSHPHPERFTECMEGTIAAIRYPPANSNDLNREGGTVYVRRTSQQQSASANNRPATSGLRPVYPVSQSGLQPVQAGSSKPPPPHAPKPAWAPSTQNSAAGAQSATTSYGPSSASGDYPVCTMCGQDSATKACSTCKERLRCEQCDIKWHGHPDRQYHKRQDIYPIIHESSSSVAKVPDKFAPSPPKMCSVCGGNQASQHCLQCDADFCDACGKKMHLHPKRKNHTLQPLPGGAIRRQAPEGSSVRISPVEKQEREGPTGQSYQPQSVIKRPDSFNNQQVPLIQHQQQQPFGNQQLTPDGQDQQPATSTRKRPVPKPRKNIPTTPVSEGEIGRPSSTSSLSTNVGYHPYQGEPASPEDPRKQEMESIMSRDVELLERIASIRDSLKSLPRQSIQHSSLAQMEGDLWNEHKDLLQRQADLERSLKEPPSSSSIQRGHSMMADIRRPPIGDKPGGESRMYPPSRPSTAPFERSQSARRPQDQVPQPPVEGWECNSCGFLNDRRLYCEGCNAPYSTIGIHGNQSLRPQMMPPNRPSLSPHVSNANQREVQAHGNVSNIIGAFDQTNQVQTAQIMQQSSPGRGPSRNAAQQAKLLEAQLPGGLPFGVRMPGAKSKEWSCKYCTFVNTMDITVCTVCNEQRERRDVSPPSSPKMPVQRQQTQGLTVKDEANMTAYEYMQLEEERMLKEKLAAKVEDDKRQSLGGSHLPPDIPSKPTSSALPAGATPLLPPVAKRLKSPRPEPLRLSDSSESLKIQHLGETGSVSPGKDFDRDGPSSSLSPSCQIQLQQERRILAEKATQGLAFINVLRQAETNGFCVEDVTVASQVIQEQQSDEDIVPWLQQHWGDYKSTATAQATNALGGMPGNHERIQLSEEEVVEALYKHEGKIERVVHECIEQRREKVSMLESYGFENTQAAKVISMCDGDLDKALMKLQVTTVNPFYERLWDNDDDDKVLLEKLKTVPSEAREHEYYLRLLFAEFNMSSWGRALTAARLIAANDFDTNSAITAARECGDYDRATQFLKKECKVCYAEFPHNHLMSLLYCDNCLICSECLTGHFLVVIQQKNIMHATCPACGKPDVKDTAELAEHFTFLDSLLRTLLDAETHALFLHKLRDWNLQKEENFRWCAHCRNGFINEAPDRRKMRCPECAKITCYNCKKQWLEQHDNITCQEFEQWKQDNDPERQAEGVAGHLRENGIDCPSCKMRYELAKGGCMHFKCPQCMFEFCCGCNKPFMAGNECGKLPSCARKGLHSHHPRDCLFHLRDWDVKKLQKLLDEHKIKYNTEPPQAKGGQQKGCLVLEQKETPDGLDDGPCGRDAPPKHAGLCRLHYTEYLVGLINQKMIDPAETFDLNELTIVLSRNEIALPARGNVESEQAYLKRLLKEVQQKLPFGEKPPRERP